MGGTFDRPGHLPSPHEETRQLDKQAQEGGVFAGAWGGVGAYKEDEKQRGPNPPYKS